MSTLAVLAGLRILVGMRMRGLIVRGSAIVLVRVILLARAVLMMPSGHALPRRDSSHALDRDSQGQQKRSKKAEKPFRHRRAL